ncbi:MAG: hypothetical protein KKH98_06615, partial [Spirochaetes bacterium]|nr:hypothetical protein [Spirochaetota bacterium]
MNEYDDHFPVVTLFSADIGRNIFHYSHDDRTSRHLWGMSLYDRDKLWARECVRTFENLPVMPVPVSAYQCSKKWGVSHVTAKKLLMGDWEWIRVTKKHWLHSSFLEPLTKIHIKCLNSKNPLSSFAAVNMLREKSANIKYPRNKIIKNVIGESNFNILKTGGILKPLQRL